MFKRPELPKLGDFPIGTEFIVLEWDVPLSKEPSKDGETVSYSNWYGGEKRPYPTERLKVDNNWLAESFDEWVKVIESSIREDQLTGHPS